MPESAKHRNFFTIALKTITAAFLQSLQTRESAIAPLSSEVRPNFSSGLLKIPTLRQKFLSSRVLTSNWADGGPKQPLVAPENGRKYSSLLPGPIKRPG